MNFKKPLSIEEQIAHLKEQKEIIFTTIDETNAAEILTKEKYINVISPFKYNFAKKKEDGSVVKLDGKHVYERKVDFSEYLEKYNEERKQYPILFQKISAFEGTFNSIVSYSMLTTFQIDSTEKFTKFIETLQKNAFELAEYDLKERIKMLEEVNRFESKMRKYNSPYIFFDRLSLSEIITVYRLTEKPLRKEIFNKLKSYNCTLGYPAMSQFDEALSRLVQLRNCVFHGNSLTILIRYYKVKTKELRNSTDSKKFKTLIRHVLNS